MGELEAWGEEDRRFPTNLEVGRVPPTSLLAGLIDMAELGVAGECWGEQWPSASGELLLSPGVERGDGEQCLS